MARRKRSSAFEDFPLEEEPIKKPISEYVHDTDLSKVERIQRLVPSKMMPDRFQPRRLLPFSLRDDFYRGNTSCYEAAAQWIKLAEKDQGIAEEVERLLQMGETLEVHGQIKPITGSWVMNADGVYHFLIETGERRFWAACLKFVKNKENEEPWLRIEEVKQPTRQRQVLENRHSEPPSAVEQACEIAALILAEKGIQPDLNLTDDYDYFRQARERRMPTGLWERIVPIMQLTRPRMVQLLNILQLPAGLLERADQYRLPERVLREILAQPPDLWDALIEKAISGSLTTEQIAQITRETESVTAVTLSPVNNLSPNLGRQGSRYLTRLVNLFAGLSDAEQGILIQEIADSVLITGSAEHMVQLLKTLTDAIDIRR